MCQGHKKANKQTNNIIIVGWCDSARQEFLCTQDIFSMGLELLMKIL